MTRLSTRFQLRANLRPFFDYLKEFVGITEMWVESAVISNGHQYENEDEYLHQ